MTVLLLFCQSPPNSLGLYAAVSELAAACAHSQHDPAGGPLLMGLASANAGK